MAEYFAGGHLRFVDGEWRDDDGNVIEAAPVRHGKWITTSGEFFPGSNQFLCYSHKHEECGFQYVDMNENGYDFCPHCGCIMDLED